MPFPQNLLYKFSHIVHAYQSAGYSLSRLAFTAVICEGVFVGVIY